MVGWHQGLNGHEFEQALGIDDGQGNLVCCSPWGRKELDMTERLNWTCKPISARIWGGGGFSTCSVFSHVLLFVTLWTVGYQAPLSMGILQARILEWVAMPSSRGSSQPQDRTEVSCITGGYFTIWATREAQEYWVGSLSFLQGIFLTQELSWDRLHCRQILYQLSYQGSPCST